MNDEIINIPSSFGAVCRAHVRRHAEAQENRQTVRVVIAAGRKLAKRDADMVVALYSRIGAAAQQCCRGHTKQIAIDLRVVRTFNNEIAEVKSCGVIRIRRRVEIGSALRNLQQPAVKARLRRKEMIEIHDGGRGQSQWTNHGRDVAVGAV